MLRRLNIRCAEFVLFRDCVYRSAADVETISDTGNLCFQDEALSRVTVYRDFDNAVGNVCGFDSIVGSISEWLSGSDDVASAIDRKSIEGSCCNVTISVL